MTRTLYALLLLCSCAKPAITEPTLSPVSQPTSPPNPQTSSTPITGAALTPPPQPTSIPGMRTFTYEPWGISLLIPDNAVSNIDPYLRLNLSFGADRTLVLKRVDAPPPVDLTQAPKEWSWGDELKIIQEGIHTNGTIYRIVTFEVRMGYPGLPGQSIHRNETVSRGYAIVPLSAAQYIECIFYVEHDISGDSATTAMMKDVLLSIRPGKP